MNNIPSYKREREPGVTTWFERWRCRHRGGHFGPTQAFVVGGNSAVWSNVCSKCGAYLGGITPSLTDIPADPPPSVGGLPS